MIENILLNPPYYFQGVAEVSVRVVVIENLLLNPPYYFQSVAD